MEYKIQNAINEFTSNLRNELLETIEVEYIYNEKEDFYTITHSYKDFTNSEFKKAVGKYIKSCFFDKEIFNISVYYSDINNYL